MLSLAPVDSQRTTVTRASGRAFVLEGADPVYDEEPAVPWLDPLPGVPVDGTPAKVVRQILEVESDARSLPEPGSEKP